VPRRSSTNSRIAPAIELTTTIQASAANPDPVDGSGSPCSVSSATGSTATPPASIWTAVPLRRSMEPPTRFW
jgi:hypothetical protein